MFETTRRSLLALAGALAIFRPARAAGPRAFTLVPALQPGQRMSYRLDRHVERNGATGLRSTARVQLEIVARVDDGWHARWSADETRILEVPEAQRALFEALAAPWDSLPMDLMLDDGGRVAGLVEIERLRRRLQDAVDRVLPLVPGMNDQLMPIVRSLLQPFMDSDAYVAQSLLKDVSILLGAMGRDYSVGRPLTLPGSAPSPLGSGQVPTLGRFELRAVDGARGEADLGWLMALDEKRLSRLTTAELATIAGPVAGELDALRLDFADRGDFVVDIHDAWPVRVKHERRIAAGAVSREDTLEFTRLA